MSTSVVPPAAHVDRRAVLGAVIGVVLILSAIVLLLHPYRLPSSVGVAPPGGTGAVGTATVDTTAPGDVPQRLAIASIRVDAPVVPVSVTAGQLAVPEDGQTIGWWRSGAAPAAGAGTVVLAGHVDTRGGGPGALYRLERLQPGQTAAVTSPAGTETYRVVARQVFRKGRLPADLFSADGPARLAVVTCGGSFDERTGTYDYNLVAYAVPD